MNKEDLRQAVLATYGANDSEISELLAYNKNEFDRTSFQHFQIPPDPEPHVAAWSDYVAQADREGAYTTLKQRLVQFQFPILAGISETEAYRLATRQGKFTDNADATGLTLTAPEKLQIRLHQTLAGIIPLLIAGNREDFVTLVQALTKRNEPHPIPDSMGACIISGFNNWDRIKQYKIEWARSRASSSEADWNQEFKSLVTRKELYQDKFIILSPSPYSNVAASKLGLMDDEWGKLSLTIRLEHECTHYFTRRFYGSMRNNLLDELIADYRGIVAALGYYRADWFLHFVGLELFPAYRQGGRLENYRGEPALSDGAFRILQALVKQAAQNLELFDLEYRQQPRAIAEEVEVLQALTTMTLEELASDEGKSRLENGCRGGCRDGCRGGFNPDQRQKRKLL